MVKVAGAISKSGEVMKSMNDLMKIGAMQEGMRNLAREMMRAGLIEEMVDDAMEGVGAALRPAGADACRMRRALRAIERARRLLRARTTGSSHGSGGQGRACGRVLKCRARLRCPGCR